MPSEHLLKRMDDHHLVAVLRAEHDPLTSSAAELELLDRFERYLDEQRDEVVAVVELLAEWDTNAALLRALFESHPASGAEMVALLALLNDNDIHTADQLKQLLERDEQFSAIANDAGDAFHRLTTLITAAQE